MDLKEKIITVSDKDLNWDWESPVASFYAKTPNAKWASPVKLDPFPCYSHNKDLVAKTVKLVESLFPIGYTTYYFIYNKEPISRTNGQASTNIVEYGQDDKVETWEGVIDLFGKRIPPFPAMTRYLVAHEYGHIVDRWICTVRKLKLDGLDEEYAKMRGIDLYTGYGGGKWHLNTGEIIANDFRIAIAGVEEEFWPHECKHPNEDNNVKEWWAEAFSKWATYEKENN